MVKVAFSMVLLPLGILLNNLVSGERDAGGGLEIPPENLHPQRRKLPGRTWESWMSPEGTLWYPGRRDYRRRQTQTGDGAGAAPSRPDAHDTSTRRYFSFEEGPQFLSEHRVANSAHSQYGQGRVEGGVANSAHGQYGQGGVEGGVKNSAHVQYGQEGFEGGVANSIHSQYGQGGVEGRVDSEQDWYPYVDQYGPGEESPSPGGSNGQYPVDRRDQYGSYSNGKYAGNVPYGQYFLNGERVPDAGNPLLPEQNGDYVPDHMRGQYIPGHAGQGGQYIPEENGQLIPEQDHHRHRIDPDYRSPLDPNGEQNGHLLPENDPRSYYNTGRDDYYPGGAYPYYYDEGENYGEIGVDGVEHGAYIPPGHQYDPNVLYENGRQPGGETDSHIPAGQDDKHSPDEAAGHSVHSSNPDSNHMIFAGRDYLPVPSAQNNRTSGHRDVPDSLTRYETEEREAFPIPIDREAKIDSSRPAQNRSSSEGRGARREPEIQPERRINIDRRIPEATTTARPTARHPDTTPEPPATTTTTEPPTTTTIPSTTTSTPATTTLTIGTTPTTTTRPTINTISPYSYNPRNVRPANLPTREHQRGRGTNSHTDTRAGIRPGFDEAFYPRLPIQRPTIPSVEIDLSKLMPEEEMHKPENSGSRVDRFRHPQTPFPSVAEQRSTQSPSGDTEDERRRRPHMEGSETHGVNTPNRPDHYTGGRQTYPRREQQPARQHSSQTGSTGSGVVSYGRQPSRHDRIRQRPLPTRHEDEDQSREQRTGQQNRVDDRSPSYWPETSRYEHGARTDQWPGRRHQATPDRRGHGSYQPTDENGRYNYAAGRDRTHSQVRPEDDDGRGSQPNTENSQQTFDTSVDSTDDFSGEGLPGISQRGACPSVSQCRCCRWNTQQTRKSMECIQPKFKTVEIQVCTEEYNGVCIRTRRRKTLKPNGTEVRMCSKVQLKRSCFVCCPTFYPRGHNQTCNGVLDGIDKKGLRISVEADIGGFYQPPRIQKNTAHSQDDRHKHPRDQASQQGGLMSQMNDQAAYHDPTSILPVSDKGMMADQTANSRRICIIRKMGANGKTITERRPCPPKGEVTTTAKEGNTAACCLTREQLDNLFLRYCCGTKRYNGREYSQRMCCGTKETAKKQNGGRVEPYVEPQLTNSRDTERDRSQIVSQLIEESRDGNLETGLPEESESLDTNMETQKPVDTVRRRECCPPGTSVRSIGNGKESIETQESPDTSSHKNSRRKSGYVMWSRVYSCCANGNYLRKVACCLQRSAVSKLCCKKVSSL